MADDTSLIFALRALVQHRQDLQYVPEMDRTKVAGYGAVTQARQIRQAIESAMGGPSGEYSGALTFGKPDGLRRESTYIDLYTATGSWLNNCWMLARPQMEQILAPQPEPRFGFAARS